MPIISKRSNIIYAFYIMIYCQLLVISFHLPLLADDFVYSFSKLDGTRIKTILDIFRSSSYEYLSSNGRFIINFINQLLLTNDNQLFYRLLYPLPIIGILFCIFYFINGRFPIKKTDIPLVSLITILLFLSKWEVLNQTFFWFTGYSNYIIPIFLIFLALLPVVDSLLCRFDQRSLSDSFKYYYLILGFVAGFSMEHYGLILVSFIFCAIIYEALLHKKIHLSLRFLFTGALIGFLAIVLSPGLWNKNTLTTAEFSFRQLIRFGYTRFLYTYFALNQRYFFIIGIISFLFYLKFNINKLFKGILILLSFVSMLISFELMINIHIFLSAHLHQLLLGAWSYYIASIPDIITLSFIYGIQFLNVLILTLIYLKQKKSLFPFLLALSSISAQMIFIITTKGVERAALISSVLLIILIIFILKQIPMKKYDSCKYLITLTCMIMLAWFGFIYVGQFSIYKSNQTILTDAKNKSLTLVTINHYDYKYIFKSELDENDQSNWVLKSIKNYYMLKPETIITFD